MDLMKELKAITYGSGISKTIKINNEISIGDSDFTIISGPCAVESSEQIHLLASQLKQIGISIFRAGAYKPRTSPYSFQGLREEGLQLLQEVKQQYGLLIISELMDTNHLPLFEDVDIIQIGTRNMQNYELLKALGKINKPVLLKRGFSNTIEEFLLSAEYIVSEGNPNVILCERGIRTFEKMTRNTLDLSAIPLVRRYTPLPIIIDPSHGTGLADLIHPMSMGAVATGANGLMIEVHENPKDCRCDAKQAITIDQLKRIQADVHKLLPFAYQYNFINNGKKKNVIKSTNH